MGIPKNKHFALLKPSENTVAGLQLGKRKNVEWFGNHLLVGQRASLTQIVENSSDESIRVFNLQGICIGEYKNELQARSSLGKGIYIINGKKIKIQ